MGFLTVAGGEPDLAAAAGAPEGETPLPYPVALPIQEDHPLATLPACQDLDRAMERYANVMGMAPGVAYTLSPDWVRDMTYQGKEHDYAFRIALCDAGPIMHELIESVRGPNAYEAFLEERGEGMHRISYLVDDVDAEIRRTGSKGYAFLQGGRGFGKDGDGAFAYFDTRRDLGCVLEALDLPPELPDPERVYPEQQG